MRSVACPNAHDFILARRLMTHPHREATIVSG
jgi:hypothetical protein